MGELTQTAYGGWSRCYKLANGKIELLITGEVGPRLIRFGFVGGQNLFYEDPEGVGKTGGDTWRIYGGHRLWHAPEVQPRTYYPDNEPVSVTQQDGFVRVVQPVEKPNGIQKELDIYMSDEAAHVRVVHRLKNVGPWAVTCAPWALSVMAAGGTGIIPMPPRGSHEENLLPANLLSMWAYTDMRDARWTWGTRYILLRQQKDAPPQKIGADVPDAWGAYSLNGQLFVKRFGRTAGAVYPDNGCNIEVFTNQVMLELETLGPVGSIEPGKAVEHIEDWYLFDGVSAPQNDEDVEANIVPLVAQTRS